MHNQLELGDYLGVESCTDFISDVAAIASPRGGSSATSRPRRSRRSDAAAAFPPPIPLLENMLMRKYSTSDGRLVITEERAPRHQYFQVHRSDGRLLLNLIPAEDGGEALRGGGGEEKLDFSRNAADSGEEIGGGEKRIGAPPPACGGFAVAMAGFRPAVRT